MRTVRRPRTYVASHWLTLMRPVLRYSNARDAFVLRGVGSKIGPVVRVDRRHQTRAAFEGIDRRRTRVA